MHCIQTYKTINPRIRKPVLPIEHQKNSAFNQRKLFPIPLKLKGKSHVLFRKYVYIHEAREDRESLGEITEKETSPDQLIAHWI